MDRHIIDMIITLDWNDLNHINETVCMIDNTEQDISLLKRD